MSGIYNPEDPSVYGHRQRRLSATITLGIPVRQTLDIDPEDNISQVFYFEDSLYGYTASRGVFKIGEGGGGSEIPVGTATRVGADYTAVCTPVVNVLKEGMIVVLNMEDDSTNLNNLQIDSTASSPIMIRQSGTENGDLVSGQTVIAIYSNGSWVIQTDAKNAMTNRDEVITGNWKIDQGTSVQSKSELSIRRDTAANWTTNNPILKDGQEGFEIDTLRRKVGDGSKRWIDIPYTVSSSEMYNIIFKYVTLSPTSLVSAKSLEDALRVTGLQSPSVKYFKRIQEPTGTYKILAWIDPTFILPDDMFNNTDLSGRDINLVEIEDVSANVYYVGKRCFNESGVHTIILPNTVGSDQDAFSYRLGQRKVRYIDLRHLTKKFVIGEVRLIKDPSETSNITVYTGDPVFDSPDMDFIYNYYNQILPEYQTNTDALSGGLIPGDRYRFGNFIKIVRPSGSPEDDISLIDISRTDLIGLISSGSLSVNSTYKVSGCHKTLYDDGSNSGTTIYLKAMSPNKIDSRGSAEFYNPKYSNKIWENKSDFVSSSIVGTFIPTESITSDNGAKGTLWMGIYAGVFIPISGDWESSVSITGDTSGATASISSVKIRSYAIGDKVVWGNYVWKNLTGNVGSFINSASLGSDWSKLVYSVTDYDFVIDEIEYDITNDMITMRTDKLDNFYSVPYEIYKSQSWVFPNKDYIKYFPFGYSQFSRNIIINSFFDGLNATMQVNENTFEDLSVFRAGISNGTTNSFSPAGVHMYIYNNKIRNGRIENNKVHMDTIICNNILSPEANTSFLYNEPSKQAQISNNLLSGGVIRGNFVSGGSYINDNEILSTTKTGSYYRTISANKLYSSYIVRNKMTPINNDLFGISNNFMNSGSEISDNVLTGIRPYMVQNFLNSGAKITGCNISTTKFSNNILGSRSYCRNIFVSSNGEFFGNTISYRGISKVDQYVIDNLIVGNNSFSYNTLSGDLVFESIDMSGFNILNSVFIGKFGNSVESNIIDEYINNLIKKGYMGVIVHNADPLTIRPTGYSCVTWIGSADPSNALENDIWVKPAV